MYQFKSFCNTKINLGYMRYGCTDLEFLLILAHIYFGYANYSSLSKIRITRKSYFPRRLKSSQLHLLYQLPSKDHILSQAHLRPQLQNSSTNIIHKRHWKRASVYLSRGICVICIELNKPKTSSFWQIILNPSDPYRIGSKQNSPKLLYNTGSVSRFQIWQVETTFSLWKTHFTP